MVVVELTAAFTGSTSSFLIRAKIDVISGIRVRRGPVNDFTVSFAFNATFDTSNDLELYEEKKTYLGHNEKV